MTRAVLLPLFLFCSAAAAQPAGIVLDVSGMPRLPILSPVEPPAELELPAGATLSIGWYADSKEYRFRGPARLRVTTTRLEAAEGAPAETRALGKEKLAAPRSGLPPRLAQAAAARRLAAPIAGGGAMKVQRGSAVMDLQPRISWRGNDDERFRFALRNADGSLMLDVPVLGNEFAIPAGKLDWGGRYTWRVQYAIAGSDTLAEGDFRVLSRREAQRLARLRPVQGAAFSDWVLYALALEELGVTSESRPVWKKLAAQRPAEARLRQFADY